MGNLLPIDEKQKPKLPEKFREEHHSEAADLVLSMTSFDHMQRPSATELLEGKLQSYIRKVKLGTKKKQKKKK